MNAELRRSPRLPFIADVEITQIDADVRLSARTSDLSHHGCYLDMVNPFPQGTSLQVAIEHGRRTLTAAAAVVYSQTPLGMGLEFRGLAPAEQAQLNQWLTE